MWYFGFFLVAVNDSDVSKQAVTMLYTIASASDNENGDDTDGEFVKFKYAKQIDSSSDELFSRRRTSQQRLRLQLRTHVCVFSCIIDVRSGCSDVGEVKMFCS